MSIVEECEGFPKSGGFPLESDNMLNLANRRYLIGIEVASIV